jgi:streptogramin lyase
MTSVRSRGIVVVAALVTAACATAVPVPTPPSHAPTTPPSLAPTSHPTSAPTNAAVPPDSVVAIDPATGRIVEVISVGADPLLLRVAGQRIWTLDLGPGTLSRIDPATSERSVVTLDGEAVGIAADGDDLWVAVNERFLARLDGATGAVKTSLELADDPIFALRDAGFLAVADGVAWLTVPVLGQSSAPHSLWRIDLDGGTVTARYPLPRDPLSPVVAFGAVWVPALGSRSLVRIDLATGDATEIRLDDLPLSIVAGADVLWVALEQTRTVVRLDPADGSVVAGIAVDSRARGVAVGGGAVWVATEGGLVMVDPSSNAVTRRIPLVDETRGRGGIGVAYLDERVWVSIE